MEQINDYFGILIQTSGIFIALIFVLAYFRLNILKELLLGHGQSILDRYHNTTEYYKYIQIFERKFNEKEKDENGNRKKPYSAIIERLRGSIAVKEIYGIEEILIYFTHAEIKHNNKNEPGITGFKRKALPLFLETKREFILIKLLTGFTVSFFMLIIVLSLFFIIVSQCEIIFILCSVFMFIGIVLTLILLYMSLIKKVGQERYKNEKVEELKKEFPKVNDVYKHR